MEDGALFGKYEVGRLLGYGAFAKVYYARNVKNGQSVAIKVINKKKLVGTTMMSNIKREITIMSRLKHPNIVCLHEVLATKSKIYFVMDLVKGGELFAKVVKGRFSEELTRKYFHQLISAVGYCHSRGVYHRDLKPENLLVDENADLKVSDFGLSALKDTVSAGNELLQTLCGTPAYVAPEILEKRGYNGAKVDVWSCGVILYVLTAGYLPFSDPNLMAMYKKIYKGEFKCPKWMSADLKRFLSRLLDTNPNTRITIEEMYSHPWFTKGGGLLKGKANVVADTGIDNIDIVAEETPSSTSSSSFTSSLRMEGNSRSSSLNAFDLISYSSGLNLSGLFDESFNADVQAKAFVSTESFDKIFQQVEEIARPHNIKVKRNNKDFNVVDLEGPNGCFLAILQASPLTDDLLVVEVKKKGGNLASFNLLWNDEIRPKLTGLVYDPNSPYNVDDSLAR